MALDNENEKFERLVSGLGPTRQDKIDRFKFICEECGKWQAEAAEILLSLNKERAVQMDEIEPIVDYFLEMRGNYRSLFHILKERLGPAIVRYLSQREEKEHGG